METETPETKPEETTETATTTQPENDIPWLAKQLYRDVNIVQVPGLDGKPGTQQRAEADVLTDFKSFVLTANNRPIDFQVMQMMFAIKLLMDVCEKQQKTIDGLTDLFKKDSTTINH